MVQEIIKAYTNNPSLVGISAFTFLIGYIEYIYSFALVIKEKSAPFPIWMHIFYFAHDTTGAVIFFLLAKNNHWFWFFTTASIALVIWSLFEVFNLYMAVKVERQDIWGKYYKEPVTVRQAIFRIIGQIMLMYCVVNLFRVFMNDVVMLKWFTFTNIIMATGPGYLWSERQTRKGTAVGLAITILIGTINTFLPAGFGMFTTASTYFDKPWFYITGVVVVLFALKNVFLVLSFPPKISEVGKRVIW
ncbi:hypothetical protein LL033_25570 (plasmid) [Clostridium estertheticum]|uniref:hypothetical protein n=1 Tax=Clostridium estertheticum TaxID=238834 RepID=UPI001C0CF25F|nr:hypothetical protein [Clostridium estertheticum]MBU3217355.1 hypothetical protein [Clostridium estertheticum]WAG58130.1 hypothetical protein LL033_25570 [Clostridium estertheticum]